MARPLVLAACLVLCTARSAVAGGKTSKVTIETDPPGAKVYFNVKEDGEVCTTPCTIDAPIGETPIIVEAENRRSIVEKLVVPRKTARPLRVTYQLKPALGSLIVEGGDGATITIDDESQGTAPRRFDEILAGAHHVVLEKAGKKLYDGFVEVEIGGEVTVAPKLAAATDPTPAAEVPAVTATSTPPAAPAPLAPRFAIAARTDIGFRQFDFSYDSGVPAAKKTNDNDREVGEVLTGATVELWPTTLFHVAALPGLSLYGRFEIGVNPQSVTIKTGNTVSDTRLATSWRSLEISLRHRWTIADIAGLSVDAGYADDRYRFTAEAPMLTTNYADVVPDVAYKAVRIGGRGSLLLGRFEPYLAVENRIVLSGGDLARRYTNGASVVGFHGALGATARLGHFEARIEGAIALYSWTLRADNTRDADLASSGSDRIETIGAALGYVY